MIVSPITKARLFEKTLRFEFEREKEIEWAVRSAGARTAIEQAIWAARDAGVPVTKIAEEYGTKDRGTIYDILNKKATLVSVVGDNPTWLRLVSNPEARAKAVTMGLIADDWPCWTVTVQQWDDFKRPDALTALDKTSSDHYSGYLTFCVRSKDGSIYIVEAEHPGGPLHKEVVAWQSDSPLVQQIKTQMGVAK